MRHSTEMKNSKDVNPANWLRCVSITAVLLGLAPLGDWLMWNAPGALAADSTTSASSLVNQTQPKKKDAKAVSGTSKKQPAAGVIQNNHPHSLIRRPATTQTNQGSLPASGGSASTPLPIIGASGAVSPLNRTNDSAPTSPGSTNSGMVSSPFRGAASSTGQVIAPGATRAFASMGALSSTATTSGLAGNGGGVDGPGGRSMQKLVSQMPGLVQVLSPPSAPSIVQDSAPNPGPPAPPPAPPAPLMIGRSPASLSFSAVVNGANPSSQTVSISNTGTGVLNWSASDSATWLTLSPTSGTGNGAVTATVNLSGLAAGTHNAAITITASGATNTPQTIPVTLMVTAAPTPTIGLGASSLSFIGVQGGANPSTQTVTISNTGTGVLNWSASDSATWLMLSPTSGTDNGAVTATVNTTGLAAGTYNTAVTITAAGATNTPQTVPVSLTIMAASTPTISRSPASLTFTASQGGANPVSQTVTIMNTGTGTLNWSATDNATWLTISPASGSGNGSAIASVNTAGLAAGSYNATVTITATGATNTPQTVLVTLTVTALATSSVTLTWNPNTDSDLAGYKVYRSTTSGVYGAPIATVPANVTTYQVTGLQVGITYYFVLTAYDTSGNESGFSAEVSKSIF